MSVESFPPEVAEKLRYYVYRLIDPRDGETFYVGKGKGDRVFAHARAEQRLLDGDETDNKLQRIRNIRLAGLEVGHVIHRHGMEEEIASVVEAALIDAYPGLTNAVDGVDSGDYGVAHAAELVGRYKAEEADFEHKVLLISVNNTADKRPLYEAVRYAWKLKPSKAAEAEVVLATVRGVIKGAFVAARWIEATTENFPGREGAPGRWGFEGDEAPPKIKVLYLHKRVPDEYRAPGAANPIRYTW